MFAVVYKFQVKSGREKVFEGAWSTVTNAIYTHRASLGSRLHKGANGEYVAYAQWPSERQFEQNTPLPSDAASARVTMKDCCESIETMFMGEAIDDQLVPVRTIGL